MTKLLAIFIWLMSANLIASELIFYNKHLIYAERPEYIIIPKYGKGDVPSFSPGNGRSYIDLHALNVFSSCGTELFPTDEYSASDCEEANVEMLMFEAPTDVPWWDYWADGDFCCTQDLYNAGG